MSGCILMFPVIDIIIRELQVRGEKMVRRVIPVKMETKDIKVILVILELLENKYVKYYIITHILIIIIIDRVILVLRDQLECKDHLVQRYHCYY